MYITNRFGESKESELTQHEMRFFT